MQVINTNIPSLNAQRNLDTSLNSLNTSLQRLSSGLRINSAKDDAAGLAISERMTSQIRGSDQARRNANDGVSLVQTAEGAMQQMGNILQRIRELAVQSANATNSASDRAALNSEVNELVAELDRFASATEFNGLKLFDGSTTSSIFQVGANANQTITATTRNFRTDQYGTYQIGNSSHISGTAVSAGTLTGGHVPGALITPSGTFEVRGFAGTVTISGVTGDSARSLADKINAVTSQTGVTAAAQTEVAFRFSGGATQGSGTYTLDLLSNNSTTNLANISFAITRNGNGSLNLQQAVTAFNDKSSSTGVTARISDDGQALILRNPDGGNISIGASVMPAGANVSGGYVSSGGTFVSQTGAAAANVLSQATLGTPPQGKFTFGGQLTLNSSSSFALTPGTTIHFREGVLGGTAADATLTPTVASDLETVATLDVSTVETATQALRTVDGALSAINDQRSKFGALQSRFESTISNLQITSENLSASRSRIRDADFASETANLTRAQILQQAGTAMLAQANSLPNQVLSLLQG
ncbi:flagellin [Chitinimonas prasina]|uniref:Flagellin n=1 Tax=Chitinimonas prasina TaxID=1434937 RepID=A0ABQ5YHF3_9NEIS|nr:flagellin [Chitinimonas prasina]GLR13103.1 flagellin [Chitinimonas prasina]